MRIKQWFKALKNLVTLKEEVKELSSLLRKKSIELFAVKQELRSLKNQLDIVDRHSRIDADLDVYRGKCSVIMTGFYRDHGYVATYDMSIEEFIGLVDHFHTRGKSHMIRAIDCPPQFKHSFKI